MTDRDRETLCFFLGQLVRELETEIDWRGRGQGRNPLLRGLIYVSAFARDLLRIPLHHPSGIGQARFRARVRYIEQTALPTLRFFEERFELEDATRSLLRRASHRLTEGLTLMEDGASLALDRWYATMTEFAALQRCSKEAAAFLREACAQQGKAGDA